MHSTKLITIEGLHRHLADPTLVVFDCRYVLGQPGGGAEAYALGHIPGARFADTDRDLAGTPNGRNGRHPLPEPAAFGAWLGRNGVDATKQVVAYDYAEGFAAARLWWMLRHWLGHERAAVLDGGWEGWVAAGGAVTTELPLIAPTRFRARTNSEATVDTMYVQSHLHKPGMALVDARAGERFRGEVEPIDPVAGHIPGAKNRPFKDNLEASGRFKPQATLRAEFEALLGETRPEQVVHQCGSGVSAAHNLLAMEVAGLDGSRLYPGSWSEWCADASRPITRG